MKFYERDTTWDAIYNIKSNEDFINKLLPDFTLNTRVDENICKEIEIVESLVALSYYNYKLIDEAVRKLLFTFELALKKKYKEITGIEWKAKKFKKSDKNIYPHKEPTSKRNNLETLINELYDKEIFESSKHFLHHARAIRNRYAHPERHSFGGIAIFHWFENIISVINEIHEEPNKRAKRKEEIKKMNELVFSQNGVKSLRHKNSIIYIEKIEFIYYSKGIYTFMIIPNFDLLEYNKGNLHEPLMLYLNTSEIKIVSESKFEFKIPYEGSDFIFILEFDKYKEYAKEWNKWSNKFNRLCCMNS